MRKHILLSTAITMTLTFGLVGCGDSAEEGVQNFDTNTETSQETNSATEETVVAAEATPATQNNNPYLNFDVEAILVNVPNPQMEDALRTTAEKYQEVVVSIQSSADDAIAEFREPMTTEIEEGRVVIADQEAIIKKECEEITSEEQNDQCQKLKENVFNIQERIKETEVELANRTGEIEVQVKNKLEKLKTDFLNRVNKMRHEEGLEKVNPFE